MGLGFRGLGFRGLGFRGSGVRGLGFRGLGFRVWGFRVPLVFNLNELLSSNLATCGSTAWGFKPYFSTASFPNRYQDPPCTLKWGYMVPNSRYLGPNRG